MKPDRFEDVDRDLSSWVVTTTHWGTRFYLADNESETATDILGRAKRFRWKDQAGEAAKRAEAELASWCWEPMRVAEIMAGRAE